MSSRTPDPGAARSAERANERIHAVHLRAAEELRDLTPDERAEYQRLRGVWVRAGLAA